MGLSSTQGLDIGQICFFVPALLISLLICIRHGFARRSGWVLLVLLCSVRISGAACDLAARQESNDTGAVSSEIASIVLGGIGVSFLISVLSSVLQRVNRNMSTPAVAPPLVKYIYLPVLLSIILSIIGGIKQANYDNQSDTDNGLKFTKTAIILFLVVFLLVLVLLLLILVHMERVQQHERRLVFAVAVAAPFLLVRIVYSIIQACDPFSSVFDRLDPNIWARAFMDVFEEFVVVLVMLIAGMITLSEEQSTAGTKSGRNENGSVMTTF